MISLDEIKNFKKEIEEYKDAVLSVYCDINPAKPENKNRAWITRVKNSLKEIKELHKKEKGEKSLYEEIITILEQIRPEAKTLALFAGKGESKKLFIKRFDLQVELPVVEVGHGKVDVHYGEPYITPLLYAFDEYERTAVIHLAGSGNWKFYEIFLNEIKEFEEAFEEITKSEWSDIIGYDTDIKNLLTKTKEIKDKERFKEKVKVWIHKIYSKLARLVENATNKLGISRIVLMGEQHQTSFFEKYLSKNIRRKIVGHIGNPKNIKDPSPKEILERVLPILEESERKEEMELLEKVKYKGVYGLDNVLEALLTGQVFLLIVPWNLNIEVWKCDEGWIASKKEDIEGICNNVQKVPLKKIIFDVARDFGTRLEFVIGEPEKKLIEEFDGIAALLR